MKTLDPIGLFRYLNPRASGLIVFKGGGGGASAAEVDSSVAAGTAAVNENTNARAAEAAEVGATITSNQDTMMGNQDQLKTGQSDIRRDIANIPQTTVVSQTVDTSGIENRIGSLEGTTDRGFADVGGRLDTVNNTLGDVQGSVDTGFADMNQNFNDITEGQTGIQNTLTDVAGNMTERFDTVDNTLDTGFSGVNENINTQFDAQNQNLTDMSANILGGQTNLQSYLEGMSDRNDTYYGGLAEGQSNIMGEVGGLQTGLASFRDAYDANTTLANQTRAELLDTVSGGFNRTREAIADNFGDTQRDIANVSGQIEQQGRQEQAGEQSIQRDFTAAIRELSAGMSAGSEDQAAAQQDVINRIDTVKQVLATQSENLPEDIRRQYTQLATSFDENGRLIRESVDAQGLVTRRAMDNQSNVLLAQFNQQGDMLGQSMFNMNALLKQMDQLGYTGMGRQPGDLAPQQLVNRRAAIDSGLMQRQDPYFNTFG